MKIKVDEPVMDLLTGEQMELDGRKTVVRHLIIKAGTMPLQNDPENVGEAAAAWEIAARAAVVPIAGDLELSVDEASLIKTRAFKNLLLYAAGPLHAAIEQAADAEEREKRAAKLEAEAAT